MSNKSGQYCHKLYSAYRIIYVEVMSEWISGIFSHFIDFIVEEWYIYGIQIGYGNSLLKLKNIFAWLLLRRFELVIYV